MLLISLSPSSVLPATSLSFLTDCCFLSRRNPLTSQLLLGSAALSIRVSFCLFLCSLISTSYQLLLLLLSFSNPFSPINFIFSLPLTFLAFHHYPLYLFNFTFFFTFHLTKFLLSARSDFFSETALLRFCKKVSSNSIAQLVSTCTLGFFFFILFFW